MMDRKDNESIRLVRREEFNQGFHNSPLGKLDNGLARLQRPRCVLLHGTHSECSKKILGSCLFKPFLTSNLAVAYCFAAAAVQYDRRHNRVAARPVILEVNVQSRLLRPDRSSLYALLAGDLGSPDVLTASSAPASWGQSGEAHWVTPPFDLDERTAEAKRIDSLGRAFTALDSLRLTRSACYLGDIPASDLTVVSPPIPDFSRCEDFVRDRWGPLYDIEDRNNR
jgi:hypothetical protein